MTRQNINILLLSRVVHYVTPAHMSYVSYVKTFLLQSFLSFSGKCFSFKKRKKICGEKNVFPETGKKNPCPLSARCFLPCMFIVSTTQKAACVAQMMQSDASWLFFRLKRLDVTFPKRHIYKKKSHEWSFASCKLVWKYSNPL